MIAAILTLTLLAFAPAAEAVDERPIVLVGGTIVDVSDSGGRTADIRDAIVVIRGGEIVAAGPRKKTKIPAGARRVRIDGAYIVPGLNDVFAGLNSQAQANAYLYMGVTSIVGSDEPGPNGRRGPLLMNARPGPRVHRLGFVHGMRRTETGFVERSTEEILEQIEEVIREGARVLLLHYRLTPEQSRLAVARARQAGLPVIGELGRTTYSEGIDLGMDAFVHTSRYSLELAPADLRAAVAKDPFGPPAREFGRYLARLDADDPAIAQWGARLAQAHVALIPTLSLYYLDLPGHENPWNEEIAAILDPKGIHLPADRTTGLRETTPESVARAESLLRIETRYQRAGARYLAGSGTSAFGTLPGISLHNELRMLTGLGLTPRQALAAATSNVGEVFGWKTVGQVKKGFGADLLIVDADPSKDIRNLKKIRMVILNGTIVDREAIKRPPASKSH